MSMNLFTFKIIKLKLLKMRKIIGVSIMIICLLFVTIVSKSTGSPGGAGFIGNVVLFGGFFYGFTLLRSKKDS